MSSAHGPRRAKSLEPRDPERSRIINLECVAVKWPQPSPIGQSEGEFLAPRRSGALALDEREYVCGLRDLFLAAGANEGQKTA